MGPLRIGLHAPFASTAEIIAPLPSFSQLEICADAHHTAVYNLQSARKISAPHFVQYPTISHLKPESLSVCSVTHLHNQNQNPSSSSQISVLLQVTVSTCGRRGLIGGLVLTAACDVHEAAETGNFAYVNTRNRGMKRISWVSGF